MIVWHAMELRGVGTKTNGVFGFQEIRRPESAESAAIEVEVVVLRVGLSLVGCLAHGFACPSTSPQTRRSTSPVHSSPRRLGDFAVPSSWLSMPWRVRRDFRHLSQAAHSFLERSRVLIHPLCVIAKPIHSTRRVLWPPAVAPKLRHSHASTIESANAPLQDMGRPHAGDNALDSFLRLDRPKEEGAEGSNFIPLVPPPEVLSILDSLFARYPSRCTITDLRQAQSAYDLAAYLRHPRAFSIALHFLQEGEPDRALWLLHLATQIGASCSPKSWHYLTTKLADLEEWRGVRNLAGLARQRLGFTTVRLLNWRLRAWMENQRYVSVEDVLAMFRREHVSPSRLTFHLLVAMHLRNCDLAAALTGLRAMESAGFPVTAKTCAIIVLGYRSFGLTPSIKAQALAAIGTGDDKVSSLVLNGLIHLLLDAEDMTGAVDVLSSVSQTHGGRLFGHGAGSIQGGDAGAGSSVVAVTRSAPPRNLVNVTTYNILLNHLSRQGDLARAMHVLQQMHVAEVLPDSNTAAALVRLYFSAGYPNDAIHVVAGVLGDYPETIDLLASLGFLRTTPPELPIPPPTPPTTHIFNALLRSIKRKRGLRDLDVVLAIMRIVKVNLNVTTTGIILSGLRRHTRPGELIRIARLLKSGGITPARDHLHVLLEAMLSHERAANHSRGWIQPLPSTHPSPSKVPPTSSSSSTQESPLSLASQPVAGITFSRLRSCANHLRPIVQSLSARGVRGDRATFALRIKHLAVIKRDVEAARQQFRTMVKLGFRPNRYHYGALMEGYAATGDLRAAAEVMQAAADAGLKPDVKMHTILIAGHARLARTKAAMKAFRTMLADGIHPDVPAIDALVSAFFRRREYGAARRLLLRLWPQVAPLPDDLVEAPLRELAHAFRALHPANADTPRMSSRKRRRVVHRLVHKLLPRGRKSVGMRVEKEATESARNIVSIDTPAVVQ
ncbi:hypothetical protein LXA43DRAFT_1081085 [Ganoderma leucocontextum]|nr:hypothetical protein LXA43DRAFT_1081085 [Ganoderma leucocontextum]